MQATNLISLIVLLFLLSGLTALSYFQVKKVKAKVGKVINGKIENRRISKLIKKAQDSGRTKFIIYMWLWQSLIFSITITIVTGIMDLLIAKNEPDPKKYLIYFAVVLALSSLNEAIKANSIWHSIRKQEKP